MYQDFWGFSSKPFENDLNPDFLYFSEKHEEALVRMLFTVSEHKGLMLLTGDGGTGKTFVSRIFFSELSRRRYRGAHVNVIEDSPESILRQWNMALGLNNRDADLVGLMETLREYGAASSVEMRETILMADNAENIRKRETFTMLKNVLSLERGGKRLFTLFLTGQKSLFGRVESHPGLLSAIDISYVLRGLSQEETANYVAHRLRMAGGRQDIFTEDALAEIYVLSEGIPRTINSLADLALFTAAGKGSEKVDEGIVKEAKSELLQLKEV